MYDKVLALGHSFSHDYKVAEVALRLDHARWHQLHQFVEQEGSFVFQLGRALCARSFGARGAGGGTGNGFGDAR